jgi:hypothetical protein
MASPDLAFPNLAFPNGFGGLTYRYRRAAVAAIGLACAIGAFKTAAS